MPYPKPLTILHLLIKPFSNRVMLGEGGLVIFNFTHSLASGKAYLLIVGETVISLLVLCVLYGYNDYTDAEEDKHNPKKDLQFIYLIQANRQTFLVLICTVQILTVGTSLILLGWQKAVCLAILYAINFAYSRKVKSMPLADMGIVSLWGGLYICLSGNFSLGIALSAGLMVGIAHFFQVITDKEIDEKNKISTSAVALRGYEQPILLALCLLLMAMLYMATGVYQLSVLGALPFFFYIFSSRVAFSWYASRFTFLILWLLILDKVYYGGL